MKSTIDQAFDHLAAARSSKADVTIAVASGGAVVILVTPPRASEALMLSLHDAARQAGTSVRVVRDAIRAGELTAYGRQRDRSINPRDLARWVDSRRVKPIQGIDDADMDRRVERLAAARALKGKR